jgi:hypothetical protein
MNDATAELVFQLIDQGQERLAVQTINASGQGFHAFHLHGGAGQVITGGAGRFSLELLELLFQLPVALEHRRPACLANCHELPLTKPMQPLSAAPRPVFR